MRRTAVIASILTFALGCDKPKEESAVPAVPLTDISTSPTVLFQVFGARDGPRAAPIAIVSGGTLQAITLDSDGWRLLDSMVFSPANRLSLYHRAQDVGFGEVVRGMWSGDEPLYSLPGCRLAVPLANLRLDATVQLEESVELLASSAPFPQPPMTRPLPANAEAQGRTIASAVAAEAQLGNEELSALDFHARWIHTGAGVEKRTLLASFLDPAGGDAGPGEGNSTNIFVLAEDSAGVLTTSFRYTASGDAKRVEAMRLVNHADLDGDGVAEIIAEAWQYGGIPKLVLLKHTEGRWRETFRVPMDWCAEKTP